METTLNKIQIDRESLRDLLRRELYNALDFAWTGWRIPIYVDEETGEVSSGSWLSQGSWQPDAIEIYSLETWNMGDRGYMGEYTEKEILEGGQGYNDNDIEYEIEESLDWILDVFEGVAENKINREIELV